MSQLQLDELVPRVVAVQNHASSGSSFVYSLFDSHPQVLQLPFDHGKRIYIFLLKHQHLSAKQQVETFVSANASWFDETLARRQRHQHYLGMHHLGPDANETTVVPRDEFSAALVDYLKRLDGPWRKRFFAAVHLAYASALGRSVQFPAVLLFFIHSLPADFAQMLVEDFPDTRFLYTVRNPVQNVGSQVKHYLTNPVLAGYWNHNISQIAIGRILADIGVDKVDQQMHGDRPYFPSYEDRSRAVRLEDVHERPDATLRSICDWIGIRWHESLTQSTCNGKRWWNKASNVQRGGFGTSAIRQTHVDIISRFDRARLTAVARNKCRVWNYPTNWFFESRIGRWILLPSLCLPLSMERRTLPSRYRTLKSLGKIVAKLPVSLRSAYETLMKPEHARRTAIQSVEPWLDEHIRNGHIEPGGLRIVVESKDAHRMKFHFVQDEQDIARNVRQIVVADRLAPQTWRERFARFGVGVLLVFYWIYLVARDYVDNRRMLFRAWRESRRDPPLEVRLLPLLTDATQHVAAIDLSESVSLPEQHEPKGPHFAPDDRPSRESNVEKLSGGL